MYLSAREQGVIYYLRDHGVSCYANIIDRFYSNYEIGRKRLKCLEDAKIIETCTFSELSKKQTQLESTAQLLGIGNHWKKMKVVQLNQAYRGIEPSFSKFSDPIIAKHQLLVGVLEKEFKARFPSARVIAESFLQFQSHIRQEPEGFYPDLIIEEAGRFTLAVECERTVKSKIRLDEKLRHYRKSNFSHIIYFCSDGKHIKKVFKQARQNENLAVGTLQSRDQVLSKDGNFLTVEEFVTRSWRSHFGKSFRDLIKA